MKLRCLFGGFKSLSKFISEKIYDASFMPINFVPAFYIDKRSMGFPVFKVIKEA